MTDTERIERLERVVGTLIGWLHPAGLNRGEAEELLDMLNRPSEVARADKP